jgi:transposase-like protein
MTPHPRTRYHLKEFKNRLLGDVEVFNRHHSKLHNIVEQSFGSVKAKWQMLQGVAHYSQVKQSQIIMASFALHNYVHELEGLKQVGRYK